MSNDNPIYDEERARYETRLERGIAEVLARFAPKPVKKAPPRKRAASKKAVSSA